MRLFQVKNWKDLAEHPEKEKGEGSDQECTEETFFKGLIVMGNDGQVVMQITGKSEGKRLAADHHIPPHHEDPEKD